MKRRGNAFGVLQRSLLVMGRDLCWKKVRGFGLSGGIFETIFDKVGEGNELVEPEPMEARGNGLG